MQPTARVAISAGLLVFLLGPAISQADELLQIQQDFSSDPGWDHYQNRIIGIDMPTVIQDFGWSPTHYTGGENGEIGGRVDNSRRQAYYAMPLGRPLTFDDQISASGTLAVRHIGLRGVAYVGFFNSRRHTWRVWSSMAFRIWEEDMLGQVMFDWMSSDWRARGVDTAVLLPPDGQVYRWSFHYEPAARADPTWRDVALKRHITDRSGNGQPYELQGEEFLFERLQREEPQLSRAALRQRLLKVRDQGLVEYFHRHGQHRWWKREDPSGHGRVRFSIDRVENSEPRIESAASGSVKAEDGPAGLPRNSQPATRESERATPARPAITDYVIWFDEAIRRAPVELNRFGLFNIKRFGERLEVYLGDLTINGQQLDLTQDPQWEGRNNRSQYTEPNFHGMHNFGWSQTNWAGQAAGEIGGLFWRTEPDDPLYSYYGEDVGELTLNDPIRFSGSIYFVTGMTDAAAYFGYFNKDNQTQTFGDEEADAGSPLANMLGITISDSSAVGYYFSPLCSSAGNQSVHTSGPVFTPSTKRRRFEFRYDPSLNGGVGQIDVSLDSRRYTVKLTADQRKSGAKFDRFGLANVRRGGHSVEIYLDDLSYTARRPLGSRPDFKGQTYVEVPYPHKQGGRRH